MPRYWTRPKFAIRRLMVAIAVVAVGLGGVQWHRLAMARRLKYQRIAIGHDIKVAYFQGGMSPCPHGGLPLSEPDPRKAAYHKAMSKKYSAAADLPWFPDPPEP